MSYNNDERLITVLGLINDAKLGGDQTGRFAKHDDIVAEMDGDSALVDEIINILLQKKYIRSANERYAEVTKYELEYQAYQVTALGKNYLSSAGTLPSTSYTVGGNANIAHNSPNATQSMNIKELDEDLKNKVLEFDNASSRKDSVGMKRAFDYIADKAVDVAIAIGAGTLIR